MSTNRKKRITLTILPFLLVFLVMGEIPQTRENSESQLFNQVLQAYNQEDYSKAIQNLTALFEQGTTKDPIFKAKIKLAAAACYGKSGDLDRAIQYFEEIEDMMTREIITTFPSIQGIDPKILPGYDSVFTPMKPLFTYREPVPVDKLLERNTIYAPRKSIQEKRKKRFPWLPVIAGTTLVLGAAVFLLLDKRENRVNEFPEVEWIKIPAGTFPMGDYSGQGKGDELPAHHVHLDEYYISRFEITVEQYDFFCVETHRKRLPQDILTAYISMKNVPMTQIDWEDAQAFCQWLSARNGYNVHLPTEAQWEKAARGTNRNIYPWGNQPPDCTLANFRGCGAFENLSSSLKSVGSYPGGISPYGVEDMAGNAAEWCLDWYDSNYYSSSPGTNPQGPAQGTYKVIRGGGIDSQAGDLRSAARDFRTPDESGNYLGFRIVKE